MECVKKELVFVYTRFTKDLEPKSFLLNILHGVKWNKWNPAIYPVVTREGLETTEALCYGVHSRGCNYTYCWVLLMKSCISVIIKERFPISWATPSKILNEGMWGESTLLMIPSRWFWYTLLFKNNWPKAGELKLHIKELILKTNNCGGREER